jgi:DNA polymerase-3 subunit alpha
VVGIYISGHPLDDFRFEMNYFCNSKLEMLKNLDLYVGKTLAFGGIVSNVQRRIAKNGKEWAIFNLEGYDESFEFKIFNEDYLNFHRYLLPNNFVYFKILIKEGWVNKDTGKKSDPRIQFTDAKQLQDILGIFAKKLIIHLNIKDLQTDLIHKLHSVFQANKGDNQVTFEVMELETVKKQVELAPVEIDVDEIVMDEDGNILENGNAATIVTSEVDEIKVITKLSMPSRKLKIKISNELLVELEKMQLNFKLN